MNAIQNLVGFLFGIVIAVLLCAIPTFYLWNWLMPDIFGLPYISFWQAVGLNCLCCIFFKSSAPTSIKKEG